MGPPHGYGMIQTIGALDFGTGLDLDMRPHLFADDGGEFSAAYENVLPWDDPTAWVLPLDDLLTIYHTSNRTDVNASAIEECAAIFFAGAEAVAAAAALVDPLLEQQSPTFAEHLMDLPMGGWDDMAVSAFNAHNARTALRCNCDPKFLTTLTRNPTRAPRP
jgi:hypothetical protein